MWPMRDAVAALTLFFSFWTSAVAEEDTRNDPPGASGWSVIASNGEQGFLGPDKAPDLRVILSPPPSLGSVRDDADRRLFHATRALEGSPRWDVARGDAEMAGDAPLQGFSCALGIEMSAASAPRLSRLLSRAWSDLRVMLIDAKAHFNRPRPFMTEPGPLCEEPTERLRKSGSYPSGHAALGWLYALVLAETDPTSAAGILSRGRAYGESRVVCGVHFLSDIESGRLAADALVAALHGNKEYLREAKAARREMQALRKSAFPPADGARCSALEAASAAPW